MRLVTIHSAKGLEYPIVALANLNRGVTHNGKKPIPEAHARRLHLSIGRGYKEEGRFETVGYEKAEAKENEMIDAEARRLLYVAATRARDHMIVPVVGPKEKAKDMLKWLLPDLPERADAADRSAGASAEPADVPGGHAEGECPEGCFLYELGALPERPGPLREPDPDSAAIDGALSAREQWGAEHEEMLRVAGRERAIVAPSGIERLWERPLTVEVTEGEGAIVATGAGAPLALGDALHRVMESVDLLEPSNLEPLVAALARESALEDRQDELLELARACLMSSTIKLAAASESCWREVPFAIAEADGDDGGVLTFGRMDLLYREGERLVIVDYKTDTITDGVGAAVQEHRGQAEVYARAAEVATGLAVDRVVFVFARAGGAEGAIAAAELSG